MPDKSIWIYNKNNHFTYVKIQCSEYELKD